MSFATDLRPGLAYARGIAGTLGLHPHQVYILDGSWSETEIGDGSETASATRLLEDGQDPKVRWLSDTELAVAAGISDSTVEIGPLTPTHSLGGVSVATLAGTAITEGHTLQVRIVGPKHPSPGKRYRVTEVVADSALHYLLRCKPAV